MEGDNDKSDNMDRDAQLDNSQSTNLKKLPNEMSSLEYTSLSELVQMPESSTRFTKSLFVLDCTTCPTLSSLYGKFGLHFLEQTNLQEVRYTLVYDQQNCSINGDQLAIRLRELFPKLEHLAVSIHSSGTMFCALDRLMQSEFGEKLVSLQVALFNPVLRDDFSTNQYSPWERLFRHLNSNRFQTNLRTLTLVSLITEDETYREVKSHLKNNPYPTDFTFLNLSHLSSLERFCFGVEGATYLPQIQSQIFLQLDVLPKLQTFHWLNELACSRPVLRECVSLLPPQLTELTLRFEHLDLDLLGTICERCTRLSYANLNADEMFRMRALSRLTKVRINRNTLQYSFPEYLRFPADLEDQQERQADEQQPHNEHPNLDPFGPMPQRMQQLLGPFLAINQPNQNPTMQLRLPYDKLIEQLRQNPNSQIMRRRVVELRQMFREVHANVGDNRFDTIHELILCRDSRMANAWSGEDILRLVQTNFPNAHKIVQDNLKLVSSRPKFTDLQLPELQDVPQSSSERISSDDSFNNFISCETNAHSQLKSIQFSCEPFCTALELFTQLSRHCPNLTYIRLRCHPEWFDSQSLEPTVQLASVRSLHLDLILPKCLDYHQRYTITPNRHLPNHLSITFPYLVTLKLDGLPAMKQNYFHLNQSDLDWFVHSLRSSLPQLKSIWLLKSCDLAPKVKIDKLEVDVTPSVGVRFRYQIVDLVNRNVMLDGTVQHEITLRIYQRTII